MKRTSSLIWVAIGLPISFIGALMYFASVDVSVRAAQDQTIAVPSGWTAFDANFRQTSQRGITEGRYHRASDGSTREEQYADAKRTQLKFMAIINIPRRQAYFYSDRTLRWTVQPVTWVGQNYLPSARKWRQTTTGLRLLAEGYEKLPAYEYVDGGGATQVLVPALNMTAVKMTMADGFAKELTNINIRPQNAELFLPPANVTFEELSTPVALQKRVR